MREMTNDFLLEVREEYENRIGEKIDDKIRLRGHVEHRCAIANAARPFCTYGAIGGLFDKDHSTVVHYHKEHEGMLLYQPNYRVKYATAMEVVSDISDKYDIVPIKHVNKDYVVNPRRRIDDIERVIFQLHQLRDKIVSYHFPQKDFDR